MPRYSWPSIFRGSSAAPAHPPSPSYAPTEPGSPYDVHLTADILRATKAKDETRTRLRKLLIKHLDADKKRRWDPRTVLRLHASMRADAVANAKDAIVMAAALNAQAPEDAGVPHAINDNDVPEWAGADAAVALVERSRAAADEAAGWVEHVAASLRDAAFAALRAARVLDQASILVDPGLAVPAEEAIALAAAHARAANLPTADADTAVLAALDAPLGEGATRTRHRCLEQLRFAAEVADQVAASVSTGGVSTGGVPPAPIVITTGPAAATAAATVKGRPPGGNPPSSAVPRTLAAPAARHLAEHPGSGLNLAWLLPAGTPPAGSGSREGVEVDYGEVDVDVEAARALGPSPAESSGASEMASHEALAQEALSQESAEEGAPPLRRLHFEDAKTPFDAAPAARGVPSSVRAPATREEHKGHGETAAMMTCASGKRATTDGGMGGDGDGDERRVSARLARDAAQSDGDGGAGPSNSGGDDGNGRSGGRGGRRRDDNGSGGGDGGGRKPPGEPNAVGEVVEEEMDVEAELVDDDEEVDAQLGGATEAEDEGNEEEDEGEAERQRQVRIYAMIAEYEASCRPSAPPPPTPAGAPPARVVPLEALRAAAADLREALASADSDATASGAGGARGGGGARGRSKSAGKKRRGGSAGEEIDLLVEQPMMAGGVSALHSAATATVSAARRALPPDATRDWKALCDVARYTCLRCLDGAHPDLAAFQGLLKALSPPPPPRTQAALSKAAPPLPGPVEEASHELGVYLRTVLYSSETDDDAPLPRPQFAADRASQARLHPTKLICALDAADARWAADIDRATAADTTAAAPPPSPAANANAAVPLLLQHAHLLACPRDGGAPSRRRADRKRPAALVEADDDDDNGAAGATNGVVVAGGGVSVVGGGDGGGGFWRGSTASHGVWTRAPAAPGNDDIAIVMHESDVRVEPSPAASKRQPRATRARA